MNTKTTDATDRIRLLRDELRPVEPGRAARGTGPGKGICPRALFELKEFALPITVNSGLVIRHVIYVIPTHLVTGVPHPSGLLGEDLQPEPRLFAYPGSDPADLVAASDDDPLRCAGGPRGLIDLARSRQRGISKGTERYAHWRRSPGTIRLRAWERDLAGQDRDAYVQYWGARMTAADALIHLSGPQLCPVDSSVAAGIRYAQEANRLLDDLAENTLIIAAEV